MTLSLMVVLRLRHQSLLTRPLPLSLVICGVKSSILDTLPAQSQTTPLVARHSFSWIPRRNP